MKVSTAVLGVVSVLFFGAMPADAGAVIGFLEGEREQGLSKICYYDVLGETHTLNVSSVSLCPLSQDFDIMPAIPASRGYQSGAKTGFLQGEREQGLSKICYYDVLGETYALTISSVSLCPINHQF